MELEFPKVKKWGGNLTRSKRTWDRCIVCNRPIDPGTNRPVHLSTHGGFLVDESDEHPHSQGWFQAGPECYAKLQAVINKAKEQT